MPWGVRLNYQCGYNKWYDFTANKETYSTLIKFNLVGGVYYIPIIRYAEILLIGAEASSSKDSQIDCLNQLRIRNSRTLLTLGSTDNEVIDAILEEYKLDLGREGVYLFALKRLHRFDSALGFAAPEHFFTAPN